MRDYVGRKRGGLMHRVCVAAFVIALASSAGAQTPSVLDGPMPSFPVPKVLPPCGLNTLTHTLPQKTGLLLGFQITDDCLNQAPQLDFSDAQDLAGLTLRQGLDRMVALEPAYEWREMEGVAVIRPKTAWNDSRDVLNLRVQRFQAEETYLAVAVSSLLNTPAPNGFPIGQRGLANRSFRLAFPGGTLLEGLNAVIRAHQAATWVTGLAGGRSSSRDESNRLFVLWMTGTDIKPGFELDTPLARLRTAVDGKPQPIRREQRSAVESRLRPFAGHKLRLSANDQNVATREAIAALTQAFTRVGIDLQVRNESNAKIPPNVSFGVPSNYADWAFLKAVATALAESGIANHPIPTVITDTPTLFVSWR